MGAAASTGSKASKEADKIFSKADKDKNGKLSVEELSDAAQKYGVEFKKAWPRERIESTVKKYDKDKERASYPAAPHPTPPNLAPTQVSLQAYD